MRTLPSPSATILFTIHVALPRQALPDEFRLRTWNDLPVVIHRTTRRCTDTRPLFGNETLYDGLWLTTA